jgi:prepilin-type N-terminal cleavage/methylation domain-containing protein
MKATHTKKGFTLIELLVVIAIISLLSSTVYASLQVAKFKAHTALRKHYVTSFSQALSQYYWDNNKYPNPEGVGYAYYCLGAPNGKSCYEGYDGSNYNEALSNELKPYLSIINDIPFSAPVKTQSHQIMSGLFYRVSDCTNNCQSAILIWAFEGLASECPGSTAGSSATVIRCTLTLSNGHMQL